MEPGTTVPGFNKTERVFMKIEFQNKGDAVVTIEVDSGEESIAVELMRDFLGVPTKETARKRAKASDASEDIELVKQYDPATGVDAPTFARERGVSTGSASYRLAKLAKAGKINRVSRGMYGAK